MHHGLSTKATGLLVYISACKKLIQMPLNWTENKIAGDVWLYHIMKCHKPLRSTTSEATSLSRVTSFHKTNINESLKTVMTRYSFQPGNNAEKTGHTTTL